MDAAVENDAQALTDYLKSTTTIWSIYLPLVAGLILTVLDFRSGLRCSRWVLISCVVLLPVTYLISDWSLSGYHVFTTFILTLVVWVPLKKISAGPSVLLTFLHTWLVDMYGTYSHNQPPRNDWFNTVGGGGATDLLLILPALAWLVYFSTPWFLRLIHFVVTAVGQVRVNKR